MNLKLEDDIDFVRKFTLAHYIRYNFVNLKLHSIIQSNETPIQKSIKALQDNIRNFNNFSHRVDDNFCCELTKTKPDIPSNFDLKSNFSAAKREAIFNLFFTKKEVSLIVS